MTDLAQSVAQRRYQNIALRLMQEIGVTDVERIPEPEAFWNRVAEETTTWAANRGATDDSAASRRLAQFEAVLQMRTPGGPHLNRAPLSEQVRRVCEASATGIVHDVPVTVALGDITALELDGLCVPAWGPSNRGGEIGSAQPVASGGMSGSVQRAGGIEGLRAAADFMARNFVGWGESIPTSSGSDRWPTLFNVTTCGADMTGIPVKEMQVVYDATVEMLRQAIDLGHRSLGIPLLGGGVSGNLTSEQSAQAILRAVDDTAKARGPHDGPLPAITLVAYADANAYEQIQGVLKGGTYRGCDLTADGDRESTLEDLAIRQFGTGTKVIRL